MDSQFSRIDLCSPYPFLTAYILTPPFLHLVLLISLLKVISLNDHIKTKQTHNVCLVLI